jgi:hypothetical protein
MHWKKVDKSHFVCLLETGRKKYVFCHRTLNCIITEDNFSAVFFRKHDQKISNNDHYYYFNLLKVRISMSENMEFITFASNFDCAKHRFQYGGINNLQ